MLSLQKLFLTIKSAVRNISDKLIGKVRTWQYWGILNITHTYRLINRITENLPTHCGFTESLNPLAMIVTGDRLRSYSKETTDDYLCMNEHFLCVQSSNSNTCITPKHYVWKYSVNNSFLNKNNIEVVHIGIRYVYIWRGTLFLNHFEDQYWLIIISDITFVCCNLIIKIYACTIKNQCFYTSIKTHSINDPQSYS